jgi:hypothetical protein
MVRLRRVRWRSEVVVRLKFMGNFDGQFLDAHLNHEPPRSPKLCPTWDKVSAAAL